MSTRGCLFALAVLLGSASRSLAQTPDHEALRRLKTVDWPRAYFTQDVALLDRILADDFRMIRTDGEWSSKREELDWIRANRPVYDSLVFHVTRLDVYSNGTAVVAGTGVVYTRENDRGVVTEYQSTNVLIKSLDGAWRAVASHTSGNKRRSQRQG